MSLLAVAFAFLAIEASSALPPFLNQNHPPSEKFVDPQAPSYFSLKNEDCSISEVLNAVGMEDLQAIIERMAVKNGIPALMILKKLQRRLRIKEEIEDNRINIVEGPPPPTFFNHPEMPVPPLMRLSPEPDHPSYYLPDNDKIEDAQVVFVPVEPSKVPMGKVSDNMHTNNLTPMMGNMNSILPSMYRSPRNHHPKSLMGATVRVNSNNPLSPISKDITVAVSPMMTVIEVLRQAENNYQSVMGLRHDTGVFSFAHSDGLDCFIVDAVDSVVQNEDSRWRVTINDRDGQMVYDSFCLPGGKDNIVKPGTLITLTYVPLNM